MTGFFAAPDAPETARRLRRLHKAAWVIDSSLRLPFTRFRFGLNALLGLPPELGDVVVLVVSLVFVLEAVRLRAPGRLLGQMLLNIAVETAVGAVPLLGDVFDMAWKANLRNVTLLERHFDPP